MVMGEPEPPHDPSLDTLLDLDGQVLVVDPGGGHWVRFTVRRVPVSPERPHGLSDALALHDDTGQRLVCFDNAHPARPTAGPSGRARSKRDHRHRLRTVRPYDYVDAAADGRLGSMPPIEWKDQTAVCVVMAARGYPGSYEKNKAIEGLDSDFGSDTTVFHAGTARDSQNRVVTNGGRVLGVTALGRVASRAIDNAYSAVRKICWGDNGHYYRTDIARRAIGR